MNNFAIGKKWIVSHYFEPILQVFSKSCWLSETCVIDICTDCARTDFSLSVHHCLHLFFYSLSSLISQIVVIITKFQIVNAQKLIIFLKKEFIVIIRYSNELLFTQHFYWNYVRTLVMNTLQYFHSSNWKYQYQVQYFSSVW